MWQYTGANALLGVLPAVIGLAIALPLGVACARWRWFYVPVLPLTTILYAIPSLALFVVLIDYTGLSNTTVIIPLTLFSLCVLVPNVVDGLRSVPQPVRQAATAMGFGPMRRLVRVELPLAVPVIIAGLRIAVVSSISLASVGQLIGVGSLGYFFLDGFQRDFPEEIYVGGAAIIVLAFVCDLLLVGTRRLATPWSRRMSFLSFAWNWLKAPAQWHGSGDIPIRLLQHLGYSGLSLLVAALIALPAGSGSGTPAGAASCGQHRQRLARHPDARPARADGRLIGFSVLTWLSRWSCWPSRRSWSTPTRAWPGSTPACATRPAGWA